MAGVERLSGCPLQDTDLVKKFLGNDAHVLNLLTDLKSDRNHDAHKLLRRLETVVRSYPKTMVAGVSREETDRYLAYLVDVYFCCSESIKLSRAVEKLWLPYQDVNGDKIKACFQRHLDDIVYRETVDNQALGRVSVLVEQNSLVQSVFADNLESYLSWTAGKLVALTDIPPAKLTTEEAQCLYSVVKICLQVFQTCGGTISSQAWSEDVGTHNTAVAMTIRSITERLIHILKAKGYSVDCVLLCGTATALLSNSFPTPSQAASGFHKVLQLVLNHGSDTVVSCLWNDELTTQTDTSDICKLLSTTTINELGPLSLIRGCVACGKKDFLAFRSVETENDNVHDPSSYKKFMEENFDSKSVGEIIFIKLFHYICTLCEGDITLHYHAFQVLLLWFSRLTKLISTLESSIVANFTSICGRTLHLVLLNMDSPIEDVPEAVVEIFGLLLGIWSHFKEQGTDLPNIVLQKIMSTHWYVKGRYRLLSTLLKYTDIEKVLSEHSQLQGDLVHCLTTNHLTSAATSVYKACLLQLHLLRYNTSLHWVPATLKTFPSASTVLQRHLSVAMATPDTGVCRTRLLHAWVVVTKTIRTHLGIADLTASHVLEALYCGDEDVRSDAIALVCCTLKKAECISESEVSLLTGCLPNNIKIDSAPFRQQLGSNLKKLLVRLRDSCIPLLKYTETNGVVLKRSIDFVDWLHNLCIDNLLPGACYQRRKGSLDLLHVIYNTLIYRPDSRQRKGYTPETARLLLEFAQSCGFWELFSVENTKSLILCLLDGADEIQVSAADLLTQYCPCLPVATCCHLLRDALSLCTSPRSHESQSGAVLCKYLFQKCVVEAGYRLSFQYNDSTRQYDVLTTDSDGCHTSQFLQCIVDEISRSRMIAKKNMVEASKYCPINGLILALTKCLTEVDIWGQERPSLLPLTTDLVTCCCQVIDSMLEVMASVAGQEACPSFAEIGMALENLLQENQPDYTESTSLSQEYQYLLSYCWNNIKESTTCLGEVTSCLLGHSQSVEGGVIQAICDIMIFSPQESTMCLGEVTSCLLGHSQSVEGGVIQAICDTFIKVLTKCRHKGVIEGTRLAFIRFCSALFLSSDVALQQLPATVLTQVVLSLKNNVMTSSVTRRSAGIPIIIQAILVSEKKMKKTVLLTKAVDELFEVSFLPLDLDSGLTDLPQVHGLNILNSLFSDASLTASLMGHVSRTVILVIEKFASPSWAIRNAATRLFSTLVTRLFGQRKEDVSCNTVTYQELLSYYPELPPFVQRVLTESSQCDIGAIDQLDPRLFPVLTLISCLKPMDCGDTVLNSTVKSMKEEIFKFVGSPVYQLRHLVSPALVAMVNMADMTTVAKECLDMIDKSEKSFSCNKVHGLLLVVGKLLDYIHRSSDLSDLWVKLLEKRWLLELSCMLAGLYAQLLHKILEKHSDLSDRETITESLLIVLCPYNSLEIHELPPGYPVLCHEIVKLLFRIWECTGRSCIPLAPLLLSGSNTDARKACLECVRKQIESGQLTTSGLSHLQKTLTGHLQEETDICNTVLVLELIMELYHRTGVLEDREALSHWLADNTETIQKYTSLMTAALPVTAIVVRNTTQNGYSDSLQPVLCSMCEQIRVFSQDYNEMKRHSATQALQIAGECVLDLAGKLRLPLLEKAATELIFASLTLVQDEDKDIRSQAAQFVASIRNLSSTLTFSSIQSNVCYELFLEYIATRFSWSTDCCQLLCDQLYTLHSLPVILEHKTQSRYQQLFDQEDNSFFSERLYNTVCIHRVVQGMVKSSKAGEDTTLAAFLSSLSSDLSQDLDALLSNIHMANKDSVLSFLLDSTVLGHVCGLFLLVDIVAMATDSDEWKEKLGLITQKIPTKQELFNGEKIIFSADTGLLSSLGARSSMKVSKRDFLPRRIHNILENTTAT